MNIGEINTGNNLFSVKNIGPRCTSQSYPTFKRENGGLDFRYQSSYSLSINAGPTIMKFLLG